MGRLTNDLFREIVSLSSKAVLVVDVTSRRLKIAFANSAYEDLSGFSADEIEGSSWLEHAATDVSSPEFERLTDAAASGEPSSLSFPFFGREGEIWAADLRLIPLKSGSSKRQLLLVEHTETMPAGARKDESQRPAAVLLHQASVGVDRIDPVTGLLSHAEFRLMLKRELAVARRRNFSVQLMLFSIPELDVYRQTFGAAAADSCVRMIGAQIAGTFRRASDLSARVGASTLAVSVSGQSKEEVAGLVALVERKARNLGLHNPKGRLDRYVILQGVCVEADSDSDDVEGLMARAEAALYARGESRARSAGRSA